MDNYHNEKIPCHTPRPPQLQFTTMPESQARSSSVHHASSAELLGPLPDPQVEEREFPLYPPQLYGTDEQSPLIDPYENVDRGSQSSTNYSAEEPPYMPRIDGAQGYMPWQSPFSQQDYLPGLPQENDVLQTGEHSGSVDSAFQQQGNYMGATSALNLGGNSRHVNSWGSSFTLSPEVGPHRVGHVSRNLQATFRTGRRSSVERHSHLDTSNPAIIQTPSVSRSFANHTNTSDRQINQVEQVTTSHLDPSVLSLFNDRGFAWPVNERNDLAGIPRSLSVDSGFPDNATSRAHNSHIGPSASEPRRNSQSSCQGFPQYHQASTFQPQAQGAQRGTRGSLSLAQDSSVMPYGMQPSGRDEFARNAHELTKGAQADNPLAGNAETYLSPTWKPAHKASSEIHYDDRSDVSDDEVRQLRHIAPGGQHRVPTRGTKRKYCSDSPSPTTPPIRIKRPKRKFTADEKAEINRKRKTGVCNDCRRAKRRVCESLQTRLY